MQEETPVAKNLNGAARRQACLTLEEVRDSLVKATSNAAKGTIFTPKAGYTIATNDLTLYTTPVVYLYLGRLQSWLRGERVKHAEGDIRVAAVG